MSSFTRKLAAHAACHPADVAAAKMALARLDYYEAPEWGFTEFPDRALFDAVHAFQKDHVLKRDGVINPGGETETALKQAGALLRAQGRHGDTVLAHISPAEAALLDRVTDGGSINPKTGLPEFFDFGGLFSGFGEKAKRRMKRVSRAVVKWGVIPDWGTKPLDYGVMGKAVQQKTAQAGLDILTGASPYVAKVTGRGITPELHQKYRSKIDGLVSEKDKKTHSGKIGSVIGGTISTAAQVSGVGGLSTALHQTRQDARAKGLSNKQTRTNAAYEIGTAGLSALTGKVYRVGKLASKNLGATSWKGLMETNLLNKADNVIAAKSVGLSSGAKSGFDLLVEKEGKERKERGDERN